MTGPRLGFTRLTWILAAVCVVVLSAAVAAGLLLVDRQSEVAEKGNVRVTGTGEVETTAQRTDVVEAARRFTVTWNTIDPDQAEAYVEQVRPLVTEEFFEEAFQGEEDAAVELIRKGGVLSEAKVLENEDGVPLVGVSTIDPNSAVVLVVADSTRRVNEQRVRRHWRWQLDLVEEGGDWLVNDLTQV